MQIVLSTGCKLPNVRLKKKNWRISKPDLMAQAGGPNYSGESQVPVLLRLQGEFKASLGLVRHCLQIKISKLKKQ